MDKKFRTINDIFSDPDLNDILGESKVVQKKPDLDIKAFNEINLWIEENGRNPKNVKNNLKERRMFHKLIGLQNKKDKLKGYDKFNLLNNDDVYYHKLKKEVNNELNSKKFNSIDDIINDDSIIFNDVDKFSKKNDNFFNTKKFSRKQDNKVKSIAKRHKMENFYEYNQMFKMVQRELANGERKLEHFINYDISENRFYVLKGQLIYIDHIGDYIEKNNANGNYMDARVHVIYENGTESNLLRRGLASSLYGRGGRIVTDPDKTFKFSNEDIITGYIYILKSQSKNPEINNIKSLYKVGFTSGSVEKRVANAENESTYLYAPVTIIEKIFIQNISPEPLETALHHVLSDYQMKIDIKSPSGKIIHPREWFQVNIETIEEAINNIISKLRIMD